MDADLQARIDRIDGQFISAQVRKCELQRDLEAILQRLQVAQDDNQTELRRAKSSSWYLHHTAYQVRSRTAIILANQSAIGATR